jgi:hypothetical protein
VRIELPLSGSPLELVLTERRELRKRAGRKRAALGERRPGSAEREEKGGEGQQVEERNA